MERPEPLVVEAKIIDRHQSYDAWRAVSLCISAEGVDVTPLNDSSARVRVLFQSIKGVRKLEEHIVEFEWRVPAEAAQAKKTCFFCPSPQVEPIRLKFGTCVQYLIHHRKRAPASDASKQPAEADKPASSPRAGSGLLSYLFTSKDEKAGTTPPLPQIPAQAMQPSVDGAPAPAPAAASPQGDPAAAAIDRPLSPLPVSAVPREGSKSALSALLNWGTGASGEEALTASGRRSGRATATATPPPSQPEKPSESQAPQARSGLGFSTLFRGSWSGSKEAVDPKVVETMQKEIKDLEMAVKDANQRHQEAAQRLEALQHLDPILTAAEEKTNLATKKIQEADSKVADTEQKVRTLETQLAEAHARVTELSETHAALQAKARNADDWERRAREAESKLATSEANLTTMQNHYDSAIPKLVASENRVRDAETRALDAGRKLRESQDEVAKLRSIMKDMEAQLEHRTQTIASLEKRLDTAGRLVRAAEKSGDIAVAAAGLKADSKPEEKKEEQPKPPATEEKAATEAKVVETQQS